VDRCDKPLVLTYWFCKLTVVSSFCREQNSHTPTGIPSNLRNASCPRKRRFEGREVSFVSKLGQKTTFYSWEMSVQVHKNTVHCPLSTSPYPRMFGPSLTTSLGCPAPNQMSPLSFLRSPSLFLPERTTMLLCNMLFGAAIV